MATKTATVSQVGPGVRLVARTGSGHDIVMDGTLGDAGPRPAELLLVALGGCTAMDVASILAKKRQEVRAYEVRVTADQRDEPHPHVFGRLEVLHVVDGPDVSVDAVRRAIKLSAYRYCTVTAMLASGVRIEALNCFHHLYGMVWMTRSPMSSVQCMG